MPTLTLLWGAETMSVKQKTTKPLDFPVVLERQEGHMLVRCTYILIWTSEMC